ncbi:MAG: tripartite tricarboxylate transporter TctB family protein [Actinomycetota bacterium]|nr:tripartite tricarboxylate transporter TctB family protein [Actinomycetota bacterium]
MLPLGIGLVAGAYALQQGVGGPRDPGAGLWPLLTSVAIVACALALLFSERTQADYEKYTRGALQNMVGLASLVGFVLLLPRVGIEIATLLVTAVWLKYLGGESWRTTAVMSVAITVGVYVLFISVLGAPIPRRLAI